jgi:hypothetical protein
VIRNFLVLDVINNVIHNTPFNKIQLRHCSFDGDTLNVKIYTLSTAKRVEELFAVPVETRFVCDVYGKLAPLLGFVRDVLLLTIVDDEPFERAEGDAFASVKDIVQVFCIRLVCVELF